MCEQVKQWARVVLLTGAILPLGCGSNSSSETGTTASNDDIEAFIESNPQYAASPAQPTPASNSSEQDSKEADPTEQALDLGN